MKYMLLFCGTPDDYKIFASMTPVEIGEMDRQVASWFERYASKIGAHSRLESAAKAKTVRQAPRGLGVVTDGPYVESGEVVGGFALIDVESPTDAVEMAQSWQAGSVEIRQMID